MQLISKDFSGIWLEMNLVPTGETGLTTTQAAIKAMEERKAAGGGEAAASANTGQFAMGGIVDLTGGMDMSMSGQQGWRLSENPERSKATRRSRTAPSAHDADGHHAYGLDNG